MEVDKPRKTAFKVFYRPIEIAIRWCGLEECETQILSCASSYSGRAGESVLPKCVQEKLDILWDAILHRDLAYGHLGITTPADTYIEPELVTIRHVDLKCWLLKRYPLEKPAFLFNSLERATSASSSADLINPLLTEIEALETLRRLDQERTKKLEMEIAKLRGEHISLADSARKEKKPNGRKERANLQLIGALVNLCLAKTPSGKPYSRFTSQASIISALMAHNRNKAGFSQRTLEEKFAAARRSIDDSV